MSLFTKLAVLFCSTLKGKELSPVSGPKGSPSTGHMSSAGGIGLNQLSTEQSPHSLRKGTFELGR